MVKISLRYSNEKKTVDFEVNLYSSTAINPNLYDALIKVGIKHSRAETICANYTADFWKGSIEYKVS